MPSKDVRRRRRSMGFLTALIALLAVAAAGLVCLIVYRELRQPPEAEVAAAGNYVRAEELPEAEVVLKADTYNEELGMGNECGNPSDFVTIQSSP